MMIESEQWCHQQQKQLRSDVIVSQIETQIIETLGLYRYTTWNYFEDRLIVYGSFTWTISAGVVAGNVFLFFFKFSNIICFQLFDSNHGNKIIKLIFRIY